MKREPHTGKGNFVCMTCVRKHNLLVQLLTQKKDGVCCVCGFHCRRLVWLNDTEQVHSEKRRLQYEGEADHNVSWRTRRKG